MLAMHASHHLQFKIPYMHAHAASRNLCQSYRLQFAAIMTSEILKTLQLLTSL